MYEERPEPILMDEVIHQLFVIRCLMSIPSKTNNNQYLLCL